VPKIIFYEILSVSYIFEICSIASCIDNVIYNLYVTNMENLPPIMKLLGSLMIVCLLFVVPRLMGMGRNRWNRCVRCLGV